MEIRIELEDKELRAALGRLVTAGQDFSPATKVIAAHLLRITEDAFERQRDPGTGQAWAPLSDVTRRRREKSGHVGVGGAKKLQVTGSLLDSIGADYDDSAAVVGTNLIYATTQHFGAKQGEFGRGGFKTRKGSVPIPWGDIPPRPFFGLSAADEQAVSDILRDHIDRAFRA